MTDHRDETRQPGAPHDRDSQRRGRRLQNLLTAAVGVIATTVQAQGMWNFFGDKFHVTNPYLRGGMFAFIELCILVSALRARRHRIDTGKVGLDGVAVWFLAVLSGALSATDADTAGGMLGRLVVPLVAAWMFERAISVERADHAGFLSGIPWRVTPERILVKLRLADPTRRDVADVARAHRLAQLARYAYRVQQARGGRRRRMRQRLVKRMLRVNEELRLATDPVVMAELRLNLATVFQALEGMRPEAVADLSPWGSAASPAAGVPEPAAEVVPDGLPEVPPGRCVEVPAEGSAPAVAEVPPRSSAPAVAEVPADVPPGTRGGTSAVAFRKKPTGTSGRKNGRNVPEPRPRRSAEETRRLAAELAAKQPPMTKVDIAKRIGISDRRLRDVLRSGEGAGTDDEERHPVNGHDLRVPTVGVAS